MSNDIRSILDRLATVEGRLSPAQQKVPQLPALFKPKHIRALSSKTDPAHPMDGYMVGDSVEPKKTALEEAMAEIEEDMLSKVKKDLTKYLDKLEKKVRVDRALKDKAQDAVAKGDVEEIEELDFSGNTAPPSDFQQAKTAIGQQVDNYKSAASMADAAAKSGSISPQDAQTAKSQLAGNMMRGGIAAGQAAMQGNNADQAYQGSMVKSIGNTVADSGITPQVAQQAAATAQQYRGPNAKDITKDPQFAKLPAAKQQQVSQAQKQISGMSDDDFAAVNNFDAKKAGADLRATGQGIANSQKTVTSQIANNDPNAKATANVPSANAALGIKPATPESMEEDELKAIRRLAFGKKELDELDFSGSSGAPAQPTANQQAQAAGNAIKQFTPQLVKGVAADVRKFKGQDPTKDPEYAKLSPAQQQQYLQAQQTVDAADAGELEKFDANQAAANIQGMAKSVVNPNNMPDTTLKSNVTARKTAADYSPATVGGKPASTPATSATTPDTPTATFEMDDGLALECWGDDNQGYEIRHGEKTLPSRFKNLDDAGIAVKLYQARRRAQQRNSDADYIEER